MGASGSRTPCRAAPPCAGPAASRARRTLASSPTLQRTLASSPTLQRTLANSPALQRTLASSPTLQRTLASGPSLLRTLASSQRRRGPKSCTTSLLVSCELCSSTSSTAPPPALRVPPQTAMERKGWRQVNKPRNRAINVEQHRQAPTRPSSPAVQS